MSILHLVSKIPPSVNHYLAYRAIMKNGRPMATSYCTSEAKKYRSDFAEYVKKEVINQGWDLEPNKSQHFYVDVIFYFPAINLDCNNYYKVLLDSITDTQLIWLDDNVVCERAQRIYYDSNDPRLEITISPVEYIGVFDNASQLEEFKSNCIGCARNKKNCSILQKAIEGRIQNEIVENKCLSRKALKGDKNGKN